jgi:rubrerythrin
MSEATIHIETHLDSPDSGEADGLDTILASALKNKSGLPSATNISPRIFWTAEHFNLNRVTVFNQASEDERRAMLQGCSASLLAEAYYIEKCGMYFAPKMCLLAESTREKMLYSLFAADEATHFNWIANFTPHEAVIDYLHNPFIRLLDEILRYEDRTTLTYIVQVILEGWGINHYNLLMKNCQDAALKQTLENILKDEARHHGSGLLLFNQRELSKEQHERILDILIQFFRMVQVGPQMAVAQIARIKGHLSNDQKRQIFAELDCEAETAGRIATLKSLIRNAAHAGSIIADLKRAGSFTAFTPSQCAAAN